VRTAGECWILVNGQWRKWGLFGLCFFNTSLRKRLNLPVVSSRTKLKDFSRAFVSLKATELNQQRAKVAALHISENALQTPIVCLLRDDPVHPASWVFTITFVAWDQVDVEAHYR
jgi:hypothetical protein